MPANSLHSFVAVLYKPPHIWDGVSVHGVIAYVSISHIFAPAWYCPGRLYAYRPLPVMA